MENLINGQKIKFVLFTNKKKAEKTHPDYNGFVEIGEGKTLQKFGMVAWKNTSKKGEVYMSGKIDFTKPMEEKTKAEVPAEANDDLPF